MSDLKNENGVVPVLAKGPGIGGYLLFSFLVVGLAPLLLVAYLSYSAFHDQRLHAVEEQLMSIAENKAYFLRDYLQELVIDQEFEVERTTTLALFNDLSGALEESTLPVKEFVRSYKWETIVFEHKDPLGAFTKQFGYHDSFLCDLEGNILFSSAREHDLGRNLLEDPLANSGFAKAYARTVQTGKSTISEFEFYGPSDDLPSGFVTSLILNEEGLPCGVLATQFPLTEINRLMQSQKGLGESGQTFLVGMDGLMQSNSPLSREPTMLLESVDTEVFTEWLASLNNPSPQSKTDRLLRYDNDNGNPVFGHYATVIFAGKTLGVIVEMDRREAMAKLRDIRNIGIFVIVGSIFGILIVSILITSFVVRPIRHVSGIVQKVASGDLDYTMEEPHIQELRELSRSFNHMVYELRKRRADSREQDGIDKSLSNLKDILVSGTGMRQTMADAIRFISVEAHADSGALYFLNDDQKDLKLWAAYTGNADGNAPEIIKKGEGILGQVAQDGKARTIEMGVDSTRRIRSALAAVPLWSIQAVPLVYQKDLVGVIELAYTVPPKASTAALLEEALPILAAGIVVQRSNWKTQVLLKETQTQAQLLQEQQEELRTSNEELEERSEELNMQQQQLKVINEELEEKAEQLDRERKKLQESNHTLAEAKTNLEAKTHQLKQASSYKSQFLANMSHELRTPLNSILLLSKQLSSNKEGNLSEVEVRSAGVISQSGKSLLEIINSILDLSKIEAGQVTMKVAEFSLAELGDNLMGLFTNMAEEAGLGFSLEIDPGLPDTFVSDRLKLEQILRNLIGNAIKFTDTGEVKVRVKKAERSEPDATGICISVEDTGIGIPEDYLENIFTPFEQLEGGLARKYSGTGLGLSITKSLVELLNGSIEVTSKVGVGSTFVVTLPVLSELGAYEKSAVHDDSSHDGDRIEPLLSTPRHVEAARPDLLRNSGFSQAVEDDRDVLGEDESFILIIEDDADLATILRSSCHDKGLKCLLAGSGEAGLDLVRRYKPHAIILDLNLPGINGADVLSSLKHNPETRHIPVHIMTGDHAEGHIAGKGVLGILRKPVDADGINGLITGFKHFWTRSQRTLLIIEKDPEQRQHIREVIGNGDVLSVDATSGGEAIEILKNQTIDCIVMELELSDMSCQEFLEALEKLPEQSPPLIVYTDEEVKPELSRLFESFSNTIILKGVKSEERLIDETALFLHRVIDKLPEKKQRIIANLYDRDHLVKDKKILLVDDDVRNLYVTAKVLREYGMVVTPIDSGRRAIELTKNHRYDLILMDIMMPEMDGIETIGHIRKWEKESGLPAIPIVVATAKVMGSTWDECLEAGASDYLAKPLDMDRLIDVFRIWLY